jgi:hypothetical protein
VATLELRRVNEAARSAALGAVVYTTLNRLSTAETDGSSTGVATQTAALQAYGGELLTAAAAEDATDAALARSLRTLRLDFRLPAKQVRADERAVMRALAARGISAGRFAAAVSGLVARRPAPLDFIARLRAHRLSGSSVAKLRADWHALTGQDLTALVSGLALAGAIDQSEAQRLDGDAGQIDQAPAGPARRAAAQQFVRDAASAHGEAATLLEAAGRALT